jgi:hypothetical protein
MNQCDGEQKPTPEGEREGVRNAKRSGVFLLESRRFSTAGYSHNRIDNIASAATSGTVYAQYTFVGPDRLVKTTHPGAGTTLLTLSFGSAGVYGGWDFIHDRTGGRASAQVALHRG